MRRYTVRLDGDFTKVEHFTDKAVAIVTARRWRACYDGRVIIRDNMTNAITVY